MVIAAFQGIICVGPAIKPAFKDDPTLNP